MQTRYLDRSDWLPGEWDNEDDVYLFESHGLPVLMARAQVLAQLNGYVGVPEGHPLYGKDYKEINLDIDVHGGIGFSDMIESAEEWLQLPEEYFNHWFFGFDCLHAFDLSPLYPLTKTSSKNPELYECCKHIINHSTYRNIGYVKSECILLANELASIGQQQAMKDILNNLLINNAEC